MSASRDAFTLAFETTPILLVDGLASDIPGGVLPIAVFLEGVGIVDGLLNQRQLGRPFSAHFSPAAGSTLISQDASLYSFFGLASAANSVVSKPNKLTMHLTMPANTSGAGYLGKPITFTALKMGLDKHTELGGTYTVLTPAYIYTGCLLQSLVDISGFSDQNKQVQHSWAFEFLQPLLKTDQLQMTLNAAMKRMSQQLPPL
jgi:hypothetical protein